MGFVLGLGIVFQIYILISVVDRTESYTFHAEEYLHPDCNNHTGNGGPVEEYEITVEEGRLFVYKLNTAVELKVSGTLYSII